MGLEGLKKDDLTSQTTTIGLRKTTKARLDKNRAPGQCYNGFICQLVDLWEETNRVKINSRAGPAGGNQGAEVGSEPSA
jgi:hypothetical protein